MMNKTCKGCYAALTGSHPMFGEPHGCVIGYQTDGNGKPQEECPKPTSWKQLHNLEKKMKIEFFMQMIPPTKTHQEKKIRVVNGKPVMYEPQELKNVRMMLRDHLAAYVPDQMLNGAVRLVVKWCFPLTGSHVNGEYKTTKPDTDNLNKMLKDVMTELHFWKDDAQVASEIIEKFWSDVPGIYIEITEI